MSDQSTYPPPSKLLPQSEALNEAEPMSMQELFSRNPEYMQDKNIDDIVLHMRDLRLRLEATATAPRHARVKAPEDPPKATRSKKVVLDFDDDFFSQE
jgi:hypothetical protein